ncbi:MAG: prepilin-type N-terminal cleavage/methylation domain-containing protein [Candidatus Ozemobacteraceae bacterium]
MKKGTSLIELMAVIILLAVLLTGVYRVFFQGQRQAREIMENHSVNDDVQRLVDRLTDDIREANYVDQAVPPITDMGSEGGLKTEAPENYLFFTKLQFEFVKDPTTFSPEQKNYTQQKIKYFLQGPGGTGTKGPPWALIREMTPWDDKGVAQTTGKVMVTIMEDIDELTFYRLKNPASSIDTPGLNNVFFRIVMKRIDPNIPDARKYRSEIITSVRIRGNEPEGEVK